MRARLLAACAACVLTLHAAPASADEEEIGLVVLVGAFGIADVVLMSRAVYMAAVQAPPTEAGAITEGLIATPQAILFNAGMAVAAHEDPHEMAYAFHVPAMVTTALSCHAGWSLLRPDDDPRRRFLACTASGINSTWTAFAISTLFGTSEDFEEEPLGFYETLWQVPNIIISVHQAVETERFQVGWITLASWSGLLAVHGVATFLGAFDDTHDRGHEARAFPGASLSFAPMTVPPPLDEAPPGVGVMAVGRF
jgi:hypothetical protein